MKSWNRVEDECCVMCGNPLISPEHAEVNMCTVCEKVAIEAAQKQIKNRKSRHGNVKKLVLNFRN